MDIYTLSTPTQMILAWTLLGILLTWLVVFATLAFRPHRAKLIELDEAPTPAESFPIISVQDMPPQHTLAPVAAQVASAVAINHASPTAWHAVQDEVRWQSEYGPRVPTTVSTEIARDMGTTSTL